jgi:hypothetical protein
VQENLKDVIAHIVVGQEAAIKKLTESQFAGPCFKGLITRHEINTHPEKEEKPPPFALFP